MNADPSVADAALLDRAQAIAVHREIAYGAPYLAKAFLFTPMLAFVPSFYAADHGLPLALLGTIIFITRISDVITDPLIGWVSDRTRTRWGRRKVYILGGLPLLIGSAWMVLVPQGEVDIWYAAIWMTLLYLGFTLVDIPYRAWGAELVAGYDSRTRIVAWRESFGMASGLAALALIVAAPSLGLGSTADTLRILAILFTALSLPLTLLTLWLVPEPAIAEVGKRPATSLRQQLAVLRGNRPFMWLMGGVIVLLSGGIIGASLHLIVMESYFGIRSWFPYILGGESIAGIVSAPFWVWLSKRIGKHRALAAGTLAMGLLSAPIPLLSPTDHYLYAAIIITRGFAGGALAILIASMLADVIDVDTLASGDARGGFFFALMSMVGKLGIAVGSLVGLALPALFGFEAASKDNSDAALDALIMTYAWIPMVIMTSASWFFIKYPLGKADLAAAR
jgi:GPH family glycoside/pentoside/hexuronide:cation symporter